jgi:hypothetical protein
MTDEQLSALLRLKRYEQPPAGYYEQLLKDIHRRQRTELLRSPLWRIALERLKTFFGEHSMGTLSYAGAMAGLLVLGVSAIGLLTPGQSSSGGATVASTEPQARPPQHSTLEGREMTAFDAPRRDGISNAPHYVLPVLPAMYEATKNF